MLVFSPVAVAFAESSVNEEVIVPVTLPYAGPSEEERKKINEEVCHNISHLYPEHAEVPGYSCSYRLSCEELKFTRDDERSALENDYLTQLFLRKNPAISLDLATTHGNGSPYLASVWKIDNKAQVFPVLFVTFNACADFKRFEYMASDDKNDRFSVTLPEILNGTEGRMIFGEGKYEMALHMMNKHLPPKIQIREFNILPSDIRCNEGLEPYKRQDTPVCLNPQTYEKLVERGFELNLLAGSH